MTDNEILKKALEIITEHLKNNATVILCQRDFNEVVVKINKRARKKGIFVLNLDEEVNEPEKKI